MTGTAPSGQLQGRPLPPLEAARRLTGSTHIDSTEADSPPLVSPWQAPVYHGSSRFKKPDKSNCLFCLWFGLFLRRTLYKRANWELKIGTGFWDLTANSLPHPFFVAPTNIQPTKAAFRWVRDEKLAFYIVFLFLWVFLSFAVIFSSDPFYPPLAFLHCWSLIFNYFSFIFLTVWE